MSVYKSEFGFGETSSDHIEGLTDLEKLQLARQLMFDVLGLTGDDLGNMAVQIHWQTLDKNDTCMQDVYLQEPINRIIKKYL